MKVYIAGAYSAPNDDEILENIADADIAFHDLMELGFTPFSPHAISAYRLLSGIEFDRDRDLWMSWCVEWLMDCDVVLALDGWEQSDGACEELDIALDEGKRVFFGVEELCAYCAELNDEVDEDE